MSRFCNCGRRNSFKLCNRWCMQYVVCIRNICDNYLRQNFISGNDKCVCHIYHIIVKCFPIRYPSCVVVDLLAYITENQERYRLCAWTAVKLVPDPVMWYPSSEIYYDTTQIRRIFVHSALWMIALGYLEIKIMQFWLRLMLATIDLAWWHQTITCKNYLISSKVQWH